MSGPFSGGCRILSTSGEGPFALLVRFETTYADMYHQFYVGRSLVGNTEQVGARQIMCNVTPSEWPEEIQLLAVDSANRATDYGALLSPRPYNAVKLRWTTAGWAPGTRLSEITAGTEAGGSVDPENVIGRVLFDTDRQYDLVTVPLPGSGEWNFEIAGRDGTLPDGNLGAAVEVAASIYAHPPDVQFADDGYNRFAAAVAAGDLVVTFTEPEY